MDQTSLTKPVDLQGLSLALAQTKSDYLTKIDYLANECQPDWEVEENDGMPNAYIRNKPAVRAGEGENSVMIGQIEQDADAKVYHLYLTGDANATTYTYTTNDTISFTTLSSFIVYYPDAPTVTKYQKIKTVNLTTKTITFVKTLSTSALSNTEVSLLYKSKIVVGDYSYAEGSYTSTIGKNSHAEGVNTEAGGSASHAEGSGTYAYGAYSHAEGWQNLAVGVSSHAEGYLTRASGIESHSEGTNTTASGNYSHAEGDSTTVSGDYSHAEGFHTIASGDIQHVQGKYNIEDTEGTYAHIVGNGTASNDHSNAHTLDWSGNAWYAGKVSAGTVANPANPTAANDLTTKQYVDTAISGITDNNTTYTLSMSGNVITITGSDSSTSSITLPIYNGSVSAGGGA